MAIFLNDNIFNTWNLSGVPDQVRLGILEGMNCGRYPKNTDSKGPIGWVWVKFVETKGNQT